MLFIIGSIQWCEIARPQSHGYEINGICAIKSVPHRFASGSAEKVVRCLFTFIYY